MLPGADRQLSLRALLAGTDGSTVGDLMRKRSKSVLECSALTRAAAIQNCQLLHLCQNAERPLPQCHAETAASVLKVLTPPQSALRRLRRSA